MEITKTKFEGLVELQPKVFGDERGWFMETFKESLFEEILPGVKFKQGNQSFSQKGVLRGLHFQKTPHLQGKLVRVISGKVLDVAVDLRKDQPTYGEWYSAVLDGKRQNMMYVPEGFAHGFYTIEDAVFSYMCTGEYNKESEGGVIWNDPDLKIDWGLDGMPNVSEKDQILPKFKDLPDLF